MARGLKLECWGPGWEWKDCFGVGVADSNLGNITLIPLPEQRIELTWTANQIKQRHVPSSSQSTSVDSLGEVASNALSLDNQQLNSNNSSSQTSKKLTPKDDEKETTTLSTDSEHFTAAPLFQNASKRKKFQNMTTHAGHLEEQTYVVVQIPSGSSHVIENVAPRQMYQILLQPPMSTNKTSIYFRLQENYTSPDSPSQSDPGGGGSGQSSSAAAAAAGGMLRNTRLHSSDRVFVRAEEISLIVLVLLLWIVAIVLFVHRWGKIRMLEPYQPEYKPISAPSTPPGSTSGCGGHFITPGIAPSTYRGPPIKSSSLCFTPSMCQTSYRGTLTHQQSTTSRHSCPARHYSSRHHRAAAFKFRSDSVSQYSGRTLPLAFRTTHYCRKARSAENLRNSRMSFNYSFEDPRETRSSCNLAYTSGGFGGLLKASCSSKDTDYHPPIATPVVAPPLGAVKFKWNRCVTSSLESCRGGSLPVSSPPETTRTPLMLDAGFRGRSLDSACASSARRLADGRVTPELRVSPPPPTPKEPNSPRLAQNKSYFNYMNMYNTRSSSPIPVNETPLQRAGHNHGRHLGLQRQQPIEETLFPPHYPTLMEEEEDFILQTTSLADFLSISVESESGAPSTSAPSSPNYNTGNVTTTKAQIVSPPIAEAERSIIADSREEEEDRNLPSSPKAPHPKIPKYLHKCATLDTQV